MADSVVTLRPNAVTEASAKWSLASAPNVADNSDTTVSEASIGAAEGFTDAYFAVALAVAGIDPTAQVKWIRGRARLTYSFSQSTDKFSVWVRQASTILDTVFAVTGGTNSVITTYSGLIRATQADGAPWTVAALSDVRLRAWVRRGSTSGVNCRGTLQELYLDVGVNLPPTVTVPALADDDPGVAGVQVVSTSTPTINHTYTDPESDAQERKQVKVFSYAQYGAGGFNPEGSVAVWVSGEVFSSSTSTVVGKALEVGTYRAYVKASDAGSGGRYSGWAFTEFQIALDSTIAPNAPLLVATVEAHRIRLDVTPQGPNPSQFHLVEYLDGTTWRPVRGAELIASSGAIVVYDYESPPGVATSYRAKGGAQAVNGIIYGPPSAVAAATLMLSETLLVDPLSPLGKVVLTLQPTSGEDNEVISMQGRSGVFKALGREDLVTVSDVMDSDEWSLTAIVTAAAWPALRAMIRSQRVLLLREPGQQRYCRLGDDVTVSELASPGAERRVRATARGKPRP